MYRYISMDQVQSDLYEKGWSVVPGVIPPEQCDGYVAQYRTWLATFGKAAPQNIGSIIHQYKIGHMDATWRVRLDVKPVFAKLWGTEKLHTSFDGIAIGYPPEYYPHVHSFDRPNANTLHLDQGPHRVGLHAYQGAVYLEEATEDDWCFMVIDGSHKYHSDFFKDHATNKRSEFRRLSEDEIAFYKERGCEVRRVACPKGGMIVWDSRLVHAGAPPRQGRANRGRWRFVVFVCMGPAVWAQEADLFAKKEAYRDLRLSRHWPVEGFSMFRKYRAFPQYDVSEMPEVALGMEAQQLAGVVPYDFKDGQPNGPTSRPKWN